MSMNFNETPKWAKMLTQTELDAGVRGVVHVEGWNKGCQFIYEKTVNGTHYLKTPKTGKRFKTINRLYKKTRCVLNGINVLALIF